MLDSSSGSCWRVGHKLDDIASSFGNVTAALSAKAIELFYRAYLPDPLGFPSNTVRRHAARQMRAKQNQTLISRWVHDIRALYVGKSTPNVGFLIRTAKSTNR